MEKSLKQEVRFAEQLIAAGVLTEQQLDLALIEQRRGNLPLRHVLAQLGFVDPGILAEHLAREAETRTVNLNCTAIDQTALGLIPADIARRLRIIPISRENGTLTVAIADPCDVAAIDTLHQVTGLNIDVVAAPEQDITNCQELYYAAGESMTESIGRVFDERVREAARPLDEVLGEHAGNTQDAPVIRLVSRIITLAVNGGASDIHMEPEDRMMRIRTRVDGILNQEVLIPKAMQSAVCTRMKILADMDVTETRVPQDGRATVLVGGRAVNLRVSSLPTCHGENIVARILDAGSQVRNLSALGFAPDVEWQFRQVLDAPHGVVLVTGPTGSGKTTTLYTVLQEVSTMEVSTFTLEDPIEYRMPLIRQTQVIEEINLTFSTGLRALLRQDPDIILVGETRDTETAQLMVRAALTGHMVFSTLHTNDAAGAVPRLVDMGVEPYLLPASLLGVLGQRLVRSLCQDCKEEVRDPAKAMAEAGIPPVDGQPARMWRGRGCAKCKQTGYRGRIGIYELMRLDERFHDPIVRRAGAPEYLRLARETGMRTMFEDGLLKVSMGVTTLEELLRVTRLGTH
jgi:type II secretory ATPase GspE/PulE/Tfp pilus assembly ATPase PilB-like protein